MAKRLLTSIRSQEERRTLHVYREYFEFARGMDCDLLVAYQLDEKNLQELMNICDGLLLIGGLDVDARRYNRQNNPLNCLELPEIEELDLRMTDSFARAGKPILGICRGLQILNVYYGGTLVQDLPSQRPGKVCHRQEDYAGYCHEIEILPDTLLGSRIQGPRRVNSFHHQGIDTLGQGLRANALSPDGLIEGFENDLVLATQWHPERLQDSLSQTLQQMFKQRLEG